MRKEDFIESSNIDIIKKLMEINNGYITTSELTDLGISRNYLSIMKKKNIIVKLAQGVYIDSKKNSDKYYVLSVSTPKIIFSHMSSLYLHNIIKKDNKDIFDITVTKKYNNPKLRNYNVYYVEDKYYTLGLTEINTKENNKVKTYDLERTICDVIRSKKRMNLELVKKILKKYKKMENKDIDKLIKYSEILNIKKEVIDFLNIC